jgi:tRNA A-37 threonylcarbamoyl transferase component Bud32
LNLGIGNLRIASPSEIIERFIPDGLSHAVTSFVESLKINSISQKRVRGRAVVIKQRNRYGERAAEVINFYFRTAGIPIRYVSNAQQWRRWEVKCFELLNGDRFHASIKNGRTAVFDKLPGKSLWDHMNAGTLTPRMLKAAGKEYRRAHRLPARELGGGWSHGDGSMTNVIYDDKTDRARLIDFEIRHGKSLSNRGRHADDLLVFLLDMIDRVPSRQWLPFALCFLRAYNDADVIRNLKNRLVVPGGLAAIWWNVRTNFAKTTKVTRRLQALRRAIEKSVFYRQGAVARDRKSRRPSMTCHVTKAGMPTIKSRKRAMSEMAKAV